MDQVSWLAQPWWVNLLLLVPVANYAAWRRRPLGLGTPQLLSAGIFGAAFGFVEAAVVVYLRAAIGIAPGDRLELRDVGKLSEELQQQAASAAPAVRSLMEVEVAREAATIVMLAAVAVLTARALRDRWAAFLWMFAIWDLGYYAGLWATVRWPASLLDVDVLFLIPQPWVAQVWYPVVVSLLTLLAVLVSRSKPTRARA